MTMPEPEVWEEAQAVYAKAEPHRDGISKEAQNVMDSLAAMLADHGAWEAASEAWDVFYDLPDSLVPVPGGAGEFQPVHPYRQLPPAVRRGIDMAGNIVAIYQGYGE